MDCLKSFSMSTTYLSCLSYLKYDDDHVSSAVFIINQRDEMHAVSISFHRRTDMYMKAPYGTQI
jgi:hypothetical protein